MCCCNGTANGSPLFVVDPDAGTMWNPMGKVYASDFSINLSDDSTPYLMAIVTGTGNFIPILICMLENLSEKSNVT